MTKLTVAASALGALLLFAPAAEAQEMTFDTASLETFNQSAAMVAADLPARAGSKLQLAIQTIIADHVVRNGMEGPMDQQQLLAVLQEEVGGKTAEEVFDEAATLMSSAAGDAGG